LLVGSFCLFTGGGPIRGREDQGLTKKKAPRVRMAEKEKTQQKKTGGVGGRRHKCREEKTVSPNSNPGKQWPKRGVMRLPAQGGRGLMEHKKPCHVGLDAFIKSKWAVELWVAPTVSCHKKKK